jgi:hypothetical protein
MAKTSPQTKQIIQDHKALRVLAALFFIAVMAVMPVFMTGSKYFSIIKDKTNFFYAATAIFTALSLPFLITCRFRLNGYFAKDEPKRRISVSEIALCAFIVLTLASSVISPYQDIVWFGSDGRYEGFWAFLCYGAAFLFISRLYRPERAHLAVAAGASLLISAYAVSQFLGFVPLGLFPYSDASVVNGLGERIMVDAAGNQLYGPISSFFKSTLGNTNVVAGYCSLTTTLFAALYADERSKLRWAYLSSSVMCFLTLLISWGEGGKLGVLAGMAVSIPFWVSRRVRLGKILIAASGWSAVYAAFHGYMSVRAGSDLSGIPAHEKSFLENYGAPNVVLFIVISAVLLCSGLLLVYRLKKWPGERRAKMIGVVFLAAAVIGGLLTVEIMGRAVKDQPRSFIWQAREIMHGNIDDDFMTHRGWVWKRGLSVIPNNPMLGSGPDTFHYALGNELQLESLTRYNETFDKAHNMFIQIAVCLGIPALLAFLTFLGGILVPAVKNMFNRPVLLAFTAASAGYLAQCFFEVDTPADRALLWVSLGVIAGEVWREKAGVRLTTA